MTRAGDSVMNQSLREGEQQRRDWLFIKPQTELYEGQGGQIFSAVEQVAVLFQTHAQNNVLWTDKEHLEAKDSALC